jgi:formylglycine-generating enzyme required for sulfatase activity
VANLGSDTLMAADSNPGGASPYGAKNMAGNVWEWTLSAYPVTAQEIADMQKLLPSVGNLWNVIKGGSYAPQTGELWARTYMRRGFPVTGKSPYIGFRCVRDAK